jgi:hypothetical protein
VVVTPLGVVVVVVPSAVVVGVVDAAGVAGVVIGFARTMVAGVPVL